MLRATVRNRIGRGRPGARVSALAESNRGAASDHLPRRFLCQRVAHEVAYWCLAGAKRRLLEDYGYWYSPDGRNAEEQAAFELAEVEPQAPEWIFSDACGFTFHLSVDNLLGGSTRLEPFESAVGDRKRRHLTRGLPARAETFRRALLDASSTGVESRLDLSRLWAHSLESDHQA